MEVSLRRIASKMESMRLYVGATSSARTRQMRSVPLSGSGLWSQLSVPARHPQSAYGSSPTECGAASSDSLVKIRAERMWIGGSAHGVGKYEPAPRRRDPDLTSRGAGQRQRGHRGRAVALGGDGEAIGAAQSCGGMAEAVGSTAALACARCSKGCT